MTKQLQRIAILLVFISMVVNTKAQVTIGSGEKPQKFSVLELDNTNKAEDGTGGLRLPHMNTM